MEVNIPSMFNDVIDAFNIKRYHTARTIRTQNVGEHSATVAAFVLLCEPDAGPQLLRAALLHDAEEMSTGDVPAPVKWNSPALKRELGRAACAFYLLHKHLDPRIEYLTEHETNVLHFCDMLEGAMWCEDERRMGNTHIIPVLERYANALLGLVEKMPPRYHAILTRLLNYPYQSQPRKSEAT